MSDDLISKSKVIEHIAQQYTAHGEIIPEWLHIGDLPSAQPDWNEMIVICDCCGHAIHVKRQ